MIKQSFNRQANIMPKFTLCQGLHATTRPMALRGTPCHPGTTGDFGEPMPCGPGFSGGLGKPTQDGRKRCPVGHRFGSRASPRAARPMATLWAYAP